MAFRRQIELYEIIESVVDSIRDTAAITNVVADGVNFRYTASNSLSKNDYIAITDGTTTYTNQLVLSANSTGFVLKTEYPTALEYKANAPYYMHEKQIKAAEILTEKSSTKGQIVKWQKYPLILLTHPYTDSKSLPDGNYTTSFSISIITNTKDEYRADDRYDENFEPKLFPIYEDLINAMADSSYFLINNPYLLEHDKTDLLEIDGNPFPDTMDAISLDFADTIINVPINCTPVDLNEYLLTMSSDDETQGLTLPAIGATTYNENTNVTIYPVPKSGFEFLKWELNGVESTTENPTITMDGNKVARAFFEEAAIFPPNYDNVTAYYDGTIDYNNSLLVDKKSGINATINNLDFTVLECIAGIPFASKATVTFPSGLPIVGGLTIPIQLLYQNYDLLDQVFCKHEDRVTDVDGKLIVPSRVIDITIYNNPLTGSDLTDALTFFSVPDYAGATIIESDATSIQTIANAASPGDIILVKSGDYLEAGGFDSLYIQIPVTIQGVGMCTITSPISTTVVRINSGTPTTIKGFKIDALSQNSYCIQCDNNIDNILSNLVLLGNTSYVYTSKSVTLERSTLTTTGRGFNTLGGEISENYISTSAIASINIAGSVGLDIKYNKFSGDVAQDITIAIGGTYNIIGNIFNSNYRKVIDSGIGQTGSLNFLYNTINTALAGVNLIEIDANNYSSVINNNTFNIPLFTSYIINLEKSESIEIKNNTVDSKGVFCAVGSTGQSVIADISYNEIIANHSNSYCISVGSETASVNDDKVISTILGNNITGSNEVVNTCHSIFVGHSANTEIAYNLVVNSGYGFVYKHTNGTGLGKQIHHNIFDNNIFNVRNKGVNDVTAVNNTLVSGVNTANNLVHTNNDGSGTATDLTFKNNILSGLSINNQISDVTNLDSNYNILHNQTMNNNDFETWQGLGFDLNSTDSNPNLDSNYVPQPAIQGGENLGTDYNQILTSESVWPDNLVFETQPSNWHKGAIKE